jgi:NTE family protein
VKRAIAWLSLALMASGCAHFPVNEPLATVDRRAGYRFQNPSSPTNSEDLLLVLAFSGGGTRAAATAYGVLEGLAQTPVGPPDRPHRLLDEVDAISSVSGGSFTAAYYGLFGDRIFSDFETHFLKKHVASAFVRSTLAPWNMARLASSTFSRSDLAAELYDRLLFQGATFGDLAAQSGRPFIIINATDIALGERFAFTQDQFDLIGSDLSRFPLSRAVAASAAFPVLLNPIVLKNYAAEHRYPEPQWIRSALADATASDRRRDRALAQRSYLDGSRRLFIHLYDGGITDNLGLRGAVDGVIERGNASDALQVFHMEDVRRIAVILVDAQVEAEFGWDSTDQSPSFGAMLRSISQVPLNRSSRETIALFKEMARDYEVKRRQTDMDVLAPSLKIYTVQLHLSQLADDAERQFFNSIPTQLQLPPETVDRLRHMATRELSQNKEFRRLVADLKRDSK